MFIQKLKPLTDNIKIYFQTSLKEWKSDKVFYGILFIWMVGGGLFIADFIYRVINNSNNPWKSFEKIFEFPLIIFFIINGFIIWKLIKNFKINTLKKGIVIYLIIALIFIIWRYLQFPIPNYETYFYKNILNNDLQVFYDYISMMIYFLFSGHFAIQNQVFLAFWIIFLFPKNEIVYKTNNSKVKNIFIKIVICLILTLSFIGGTVYNVEYWRIMPSYYGYKFSNIFN